VGAAGAVDRSQAVPYVQGGYLGWAYAAGAGTWRLLRAGGALVTGATGFVGGRLVSALVQAGWEVRDVPAPGAPLERAGVADSLDSLRS
jgi:hypothetical protein